MAKSITKKVIAIILCLGFICCLFTGCTSNYKKEKARKEMQTYLEDLYDKEFVVEKPLKVGYPWTPDGESGGVSFAYAYPKDDPEIRFEVWPEGKDEYKDGYLPALWGNQIKEDIKEKIKEMYGNDAKIECDFGVRFGDETKEYRDKYKMMNYNDVIKKFEGEEKITCEIHIDFYTDNSVFEFNPDEEAEKVLWFKGNHYGKFKSDTFEEYDLYLRNIDKATKEQYIYVLFTDNKILKDWDFKNMTRKSVKDEFLKEIRNNK